MVNKFTTAQQNMQTSEAVRAKRELQSRVADVRQDVESHEQELFDVTADMTRQYKVSLSWLFLLPPIFQ